MSYPFATRQPAGHRRDGLTPELAPDASEITVVRRIRREVAERLTRATRAHESATGAVMSAAEQQATTRRLITDALDAYATAGDERGPPAAAPGCGVAGGARGGGHAARRRWPAAAAQRRAGGGDPRQRLRPGVRALHRRHAACRSPRSPTRTRRWWS